MIGATRFPRPLRGPALIGALLAGSALLAVSSPTVSLRSDGAFAVVSPSDGATVGKDFLLSWTTAGTARYAVVVDHQVPRIGALVPAGKHVITVAERSVRLTLGPLKGGSPSAREHHRLVVVPVDAAGRRVGERTAVVHVRTTR